MFIIVIIIVNVIISSPLTAFKHTVSHFIDYFPGTGCPGWAVSPPARGPPMCPPSPPTPSPGSGRSPPTGSTPPQPPPTATASMGITTPSRTGMETLAIYTLKYYYVVHQLEALLLTWSMGASVVCARGPQGGQCLPGWILPFLCSILLPVFAHFLLDFEIVTPLTWLV